MKISSVQSAMFNDVEFYVKSTFTNKRDDWKKTNSLMDVLKSELGYDSILADDQVSKVSIVGAGMITHPGVAYKMFNALSSKNINIQVISTSEIKISVLVDEKNTKEAVQVIHQVFELDKWVKLDLLEKFQEENQDK